MQRPSRILKNTLLMTSLLGMALLAGCVGEEAPENVRPVADVSASDDEGWVGDEFTFDAQASHDPDGDAVRWHFDFGDGTTFETSDEDEARVKHAYAHGGAYTVTVTVYEDADDDGDVEVEGRNDTAQVFVAVHEEFAVEQQAVYTTPLPNQTMEAEQAFMVYEGAQRFELELDVSSLLATGSSRLRISVLDADGATIAADTVDVQSGDNQTVALEGPLSLEGDHTVVVEAEDGAATVSGALRAYYG